MESLLNDQLCHSNTVALGVDSWPTPELCNEDVMSVGMAAGTGGCREGGGAVISVSICGKVARGEM